MTRQMLQSSSISPKRKIAVGTVTRNRPLMLGRLLSSYSKMSLPEGAEVHFVIIENNAVATLSEIIKDFQAQVPQHKVSYFIEPELGIASARNHALEYAIKNDYDLLTFADDDEEVHKQWLIELLKEQSAYNLDLVGSPVRLAPVDATFSFWQTLIWTAVNENNQRVENRHLEMRTRGRAGSVRIATGSWMGNLDFFRRTGLRFDTSLGLAGGEDWRLYDEAKMMGARTGWSPHAIAYETVPATRLSLRYYYRRDRDHACMVFRERFRKSPSKSVIRLLSSLFARVYKTAIALAMLPFHPQRALLNCAHHLGSSVGFIQGCLGMKTRHYVKIDGN